jgi:serine/threonine-protein kinase RsbW
MRIQSIFVAELDPSGRRYRVKEDGVPAPVAGSAKELTFSLADLPDVRDFAAEQARGRGMSEDAVGDFLVALNEIATNAVTHGSSQARLRLWAEGDALVADILDEGTTWELASDPGNTPPGEHATSGMGLWVARLLSDEIVVRTGTDGTRVTMRFSV